MRSGSPDSVETGESKELSLTGAALRELMQAVLCRNTPFRFRACGFSMVPFIREGDILTIYPLSGSSPGIGDVVAFSFPFSGRMAVHRIVAQEKAFYRVKGDGMHATDGTILQENIIGVVRKVERDGRKILIGLGPEKFLIALLSGSGLLTRAVSLSRRLHQSKRGARPK